MPARVKLAPIHGGREAADFVLALRTCPHTTPNGIDVAILDTVQYKLLTQQPLIQG